MENTISNSEKLIKLFGEAEAAIRLAESELDQLILPAINELRYAASHMVNALSSNISDSQKEKEINNAIEHSQRAVVDTYKLLMNYYLKQLKPIRNEIVHSSIDKEKTYSLLSTTNRAEEIIIKGKYDYENLRDLVYELRKLSDEYRNYYYKEKLKKEKTKKTIITIIIGIISLLSSLFVLLSSSDLIDFIKKLFN